MNDDTPFGDKAFTFEDAMKQGYVDTPIGDFSLPWEDIMKMDGDELARVLGERLSNIDPNDALKMVVDVHKKAAELAAIEIHNRFTYMSKYLLVTGQFDFATKCIFPMVLASLPPDMAVNPRVELAYIEILRAQLLRSDHNYLTVSAVEMQRAIFEKAPKGYDPNCQDRFIEFQKPLAIIGEIEEEIIPIRAIWLRNAYPINAINTLSGDNYRQAFDEMFRTCSGIYFLEAYSIDGSVVRRCSYSASKGHWGIDQWHDCPYNECHIETAEDEICHRCQGDIWFFASILYTVERLINREFATSPEPRPFDQQSVSIQEHRRVATAHGKQKHRVVERSYHQNIVTFDVSVTPGTAAAPPAGHSHSEAPGDKRNNWFTTTAAGDIIYIKKPIEEFSRESKLGKTHIVKAHERYVPYKKDSYTTKKITASQFVGGDK